MSTELKSITYRGVAAVKGDRVLGVVLTKYQVDGGAESDVLRTGFPLVERRALSAAAFAVGDQVRVRSDAREANIGSPAGRGWGASKSSCVGMTGSIIGLDGDGDVRVNFGPDKPTLWSPEQLEKALASASDAHKFKNGDHVMCSRKPADTDTLVVRWHDDMQARLGTIGTIDMIGGTLSGSIRVKFPDGKGWYYKPHWLRLATPQEVAGHAMLAPALAALRESNADPDAIAEIVKRQLKRPRTE